MTTPHNSAVPRRKNPLHSSSHCKNFCRCVTRQTGHCAGFFHSSMLSTFTQVRSFSICTLRFSAHTPIVFLFHQTGYTGNPFGDAVFNLLLDLPPVGQVFLAAILVRYACTQDGSPACSLGYTSFVAAFWPSLGSETRCRGCPSYTAQSRVPAPSPFVCLADWWCSCA